MDAVAHALADPIRRDILRMVRVREVAAGAIAGVFSVSRPAVSRHLRVLREAGLVRDRLRGRERTYQLVPRALDELEAFLRDLRAPASERPGSGQVSSKRLGAGTDVERPGSDQVNSKRLGAGADVDWERRLAALETEVHRVRRQRRAAAPPRDHARQTNTKETA